MLLEVFPNWQLYFTFVHYGSHNHHMGKDLERLGLQSHDLVKYIWEYYFHKVHIDIFGSPSFQNVQH